MKIKYSGKIVEVVEKECGNRTFEMARRSPGVRALVVKDGKILLSREYRVEVDGYDYRLPGGKVFDRLEEFRSHDKEDLIEYAQKAVIKEVKEEVGLLAKNPRLIKVSKAGATIVWDLYYFLITDFEKGQQALEEGEDITFDWYTLDQVEKLCLEDKIQEDRSVAILLKYILKNKKL